MNIKLLHLCVDNFKGLGHVNMEFGGGSCTVYGDNATGKTSIYDALLWLLFDHDSRGQANFEVKPLDAAGQIKDHGAITSVEATLSVDGHPATFRRELRENWSTRRGGTETFFDGNTSTYFVDGVPSRKTSLRVGSLKSSRRTLSVSLQGYILLRRSSLERPPPHSV